MQWGPENDAKLFMHTLKIHDIRIDCKALAAAMGQDCTPKAVTHRIAKLRALAAEDSNANAASNDGDATATPTPKKRAAPAKKNTSTTPAKAKASTGKSSAGQKRTAAGKAKVNGAESAGEEDDAEDEGEEMETPSKKPRKDIVVHEDETADGVAA